MTALAAMAGWVLAAALVVELRRRAALVDDAAHEVRGPLTAISLGIDALRRQPAARRRADALAVEVRRMEVAADDVVAAARGRRARSRAARIDLRQLVERSSEAWQAAAARRGGRVTLDWRAGETSVRADGRRLAQAFGNLLANAVEHGGGEIVVRGRRSGRDVRVEIEDRGDRAVAPSRAGRPRGRGLGIGIATRALEGSGGRLASFRRPGGGRVAVAELPAEPPS